MSVVETRMTRGAAAAAASEKKKRMILIVLAIVLLGVLVLELPGLFSRLHSSSATTSSSTTATSSSSAAASASGSASTAAASAQVAANARALRRLPAKDPFVPLIRTATASAGSATATAGAQPAAASRVVVSVPKTALKRSRSHVARAAKLGPTAAVIWTNGLRQVVGVSQPFTVSNLTFHLVSVSPKAMKIGLEAGVFANGKHTIKVRLNHRITIVNRATGVEYHLLFSKATRAAPPTTVSVPTASH